jgi:hypothetical protein
MAGDLEIWKAMRLGSLKAGRLRSDEAMML